MKKEIKEFISSLVTVANYAKESGITRQAVYYQIQTGILKAIVIDGVFFIKR